MIQRLHFIKKGEAHMSVFDTLMGDYIQANQCNTYIPAILVSPDVYSELAMNLAYNSRAYFSKTSSSIPSAIRIFFSFGDVGIHVISNYKNLLFIGDKDEFEQFVNTNGIGPDFWTNQYRAQVDREFEDIVLRAGE